MPLPAITNCLQCFIYCLSLVFLLNINLLAEQNDRNNNSISYLLREAINAQKKNNYELALEDYQKILTICPKNKKALLEIKKISKLIARSYQSILQETRHSLLQNVEKTWYYPNAPPSLELPPKSKKTYCIEQDVASNLQEDAYNYGINNDSLNSKLDSLVIPSIDLEDTPLSEAIDYLRKRSCILDESNKGINIFLNLPAAATKNAYLLDMMSSKESQSAEAIEEEHLQTEYSSNIGDSNNASPKKVEIDIAEEPHISLKLHHVPLRTVLEYVAKQAGLTIHIDPYAVVLSPELPNRENFITKEYLISSPSIFMKAKESHHANMTPLLAKEFFEQEGITFPEGSSANYFDSSHKLIVRNTRENIDLINILIVTSQNKDTLQVSIETKFIEVSQDQLEKFGLSWLLGALQIGNSGINVNARGGQDVLNTDETPLIDKAIDSISNLPSKNSVVQENPMDAVIDNMGSNRHDTTFPAGLFSITGVYTNPQFQIILQAMHQKKGIDLMAAPHVTTKDGVKATVKIIDEFIYPTDYTPPQIPQSTTNSGGNILHEAPPTIAPSFPSNWTKRDLGVFLEAKPTIGPDGYTIDLELHPQITDFDGFINYGSPINTIGYHFSTSNGCVTPFSSTLTTNTMNQPVFTVREVNTSVTVYDGQTVVLGGLIREDIKKFEEKIPVLGDIPLAGKLFRYKSDKKLKKNLIIFVTPKILNQDGIPLSHVNEHISYSSQ